MPLPRWIVNVSLAASLSLGVPSPRAAAGEPPPTNAAAAYREAITALGHSLGAPDPAKAGGTRPARLFTDEESSLIADVRDAEQVTPELRAALRKAGPAMDAARRAASLGRCDWGLDRSQGFQTLLPHYAPMREMARLFRAEAAVRMADGDLDGAIASIGALSGVARHASEDRLLLGSLVGSAIGAVADGSIQSALDRGLIDGSKAATLIEALRPLAGTDPFRYVESIEGEREMMNTTVRISLEDDDDLDELVELLAPEQREAFSKVATDEALAQLAVCDLLLQRSAEALAEPDPQKASELLDGIEQAIEDGSAGVLGKLLLPTIRSVNESKRRSESMLASRFAQLRDLASGAKSPAQLANAATWYLAAARATAAIPADEQRLIEMARVSGGALDETFAVLAARAIDRHRRAVIDPLLAGAAAGRCEFVPRTSRAAGFVGLPPYTAGLRAAVRTLLASALLAAREAANPKTAEATRAIWADAAVRELVTALRVVEHVSSDPKLAHAALAQAILGEASEAMAAALTTDAIDAQRAKAIANAVDALDRADPLGHRRGLAADREAILTEIARAEAAVSSPGPDDDAEQVRRLRRKLIERLDASTLLSVAIAKQAIGSAPAAPPALSAPGDDPTLSGSPSFDCGARDNDPLLDLSDLYVQDMCAALAARSQEILSSVIFRGDDVATLTKGPPIAGAPLPVVVDLNIRALEAPGLIAALDKLLRAATGG